MKVVLEGLEELKYMALFIDRECLIKTGTYSEGFEDKSDAFVVDYMRDIMGKYLREV